MVGKIRRRCSALSFLRADEIEWAEGGALCGIGVEVPLQSCQFLYLLFSIKIVSLPCEFTRCLFRHTQVVDCIARATLKLPLAKAVAIGQARRRPSHDV